jgi:hypothetical protein
MSSRLIVNGRVVVSTYRPVKHSQASSHIVRDTAGNPIVGSDQPAAPITWYPGRVHREHLWVCPTTGLQYTIHDMLAMGDGWVSVTTVMEWYSIGYDRVLQLLKTGLLDGAVQRGCPTKFYRVRDPRMLERLLALGTLPTLPVKTPRTRPSRASK